MTKEPSQADIDRFKSHLRDMVDEHGWAVQGVFPTEEHPGYSWQYTIGLWERWQHPELVIFGLPPNVGATLLNRVGDRVSSGERIESGRVYDDILVDTETPMPARFVDVLSRYVGHDYDYFNVGRAFYGHADFEVMQLVWPDEAGLFPGDEDYEMKYLEIQPILNAPA